MGSGSPHDNEMNKDLKRVQKECADKEQAVKERIRKEHADEEERVDKERTDKERADEKRADKERAERERTIRITVTDPLQVTVEIAQNKTVRVFLEKVAPLLGLDKSDAPSLQAEFSGTILGHELELNGAGMCDESLCSVLGVEAALTTRAKDMDIVQAAKEGRIADVQFVLQHAPEKVNAKDKVLLLLRTHTLLIMVVGQNGFTALHWAAQKNRVEVAEVLVAANANVGAKSKVRAGFGLVLVSDSDSVVLVGQSGWTALHRAACNNSREVAEVLVAVNANVDIREEVRAGCSWLGAGY